MIFSEVTKLQHEVARRKGWSVESVGVQFGLFNPDHILVGMPCASSDKAWRVGLDNSVPKWGRDLNVTWDLVVPEGVVIEPLAGLGEVGRILVKVGGGKPQVGTKQEIVVLLVKAWVELQRSQEKSNVDHVDA